MTVVVSAKFPELSKLFDQAPEIVGLEVRVALGEIMKQFRRKVERRTTPGLRRLLKTKPWLMRTNIRPGRKNENERESSLRNLFASRRIGLNYVNGEVLVSAPFLLAHEYGERIAPRRKQSLAIPVLPKRLRSGTYKAKGPRKFEKQTGLDLFPIKRRRGGSNRMLLGYRSPETGRVQPAFLLQRSVYIKPQLGVRRTWDSEKQFRDSLLREVLGKIVANIETLSRTTLRPSRRVA